MEKTPEKIPKEKNERNTSEKGNKIKTPEGFRLRGDSTQSERKAATLKRDELKQELIELTLNYFDSEETRSSLEYFGVLEFQVGSFTAEGCYEEYEEDLRFQVNYYKGEKWIATVTWEKNFGYSAEATFDDRNKKHVRELIRALRTEEPVILR